MELKIGQIIRYNQKGFGFIKSLDYSHEYVIPSDVFFHISKLKHLNIESNLIEVDKKPPLYLWYVSEKTAKGLEVKECWIDYTLIPEEYLIGFIGKVHLFFLREKAQLLDPVLYNFFAPPASCHDINTILSILKQGSFSNISLNKAFEKLKVEIEQLKIVAKTLRRRTLEETICGSIEIFDSSTLEKNGKQQRIGRFIVQDGIATDTDTGLMWCRLTLHEGRYSRGFSRTEVTSAVEQFNQQGGESGFTDWRLPTLDELSVLTGLRKLESAESGVNLNSLNTSKRWAYLDVKVFPDAALYISEFVSEFVGNPNDFYTPRVWCGHKNTALGVYYYGSNYSTGDGRSRLNSIRLVRGEAVIDMGKAYVVLLDNMSKPQEIRSKLLALTLPEQPANSE